MKLQSCQQDIFVECKMKESHRKKRCGASRTGPARGGQRREHDWKWREKSFNF